MGLFSRKAGAHRETGENDDCGCGARFGSQAELQVHTKKHHTMK